MNALSELQKQQVIDNIPLSVYAARKRLRPRGRLTLDELVSAAQWGLVKAVLGFDSARGTKFSTFAVRCMNRSMTDEINQPRAISLPLWVLQKKEQEDLRKRHLNRDELAARRKRDGRCQDPWVWSDFQRARRTVGLKAVER